MTPDDASKVRVGMKLEGLINELHKDFDYLETKSKSKGGIPKHKWKCLHYDLQKIRDTVCQVLELEQQSTG